MLPGNGVTILSAADELGSLLDKTGKFYCRGGTVMRAKLSDGGPPNGGQSGDGTLLEPVSAAAICSEFETVAILKQHKSTADESRIVDATCSESMAKLIIESRVFRNRLSPINVVSRCPVLIERDGELTQVSGYDRGSGILANGPTAPEVPVAEAVRILTELFDDFRPATSGDKARAIAAVITPALVFGGLLNGRAPIDVGEADDSQAGKGYRNKLTAAIYKATQRSVTQRNGGVGSIQESFDKAVIGGAQFITFDNLRGNLDFPGLESFCTEDRYFARVPYGSPAEIDPRRVILMLTSNRAEMTRDLANRSSCVRILKQSPDYQYRTFAEGWLLDHVHANQPRYFGTVFAVIREWHRRGKPELATTAHDFRRWARVLGWITENLFGVGDLLAGHGEAQLRIATPGLNWLRDVALGVQRANRLGTWLRGHDLLQVVLDQGIETAGIHPDADFEASDVWLKGAQAIGRKLGKLFKSDEVQIDNFRIERRQGMDASSRLKTEYAFLAGFPNDPQCPPISSPIETRVSPMPPMTSQHIDAHTHARAHAHTRESCGIPGTGGLVGNAGGGPSLLPSRLDRAPGCRWPRPSQMSPLRQTLRLQKSRACGRLVGRHEAAGGGGKK